MKSFLLGIALLFSVATDCFSQKPPAKFGDVSLEDLKMDRYDKDTAAAAVVLVEFGEGSLEYDQEEGFYLSFECLRRVKILKKDGLKYGDFLIPVYKSGTVEEKLAQLKATTYNLENGKLQETKMKNDAVFREAVDKNVEEIKFSLPNLKVGSVIEVSYKIRSEFIWHFRDWEFQGKIPVKWSEFRAKIPEYFNYNKYTQGYLTYFVNEHTTAPGSITLNYKERSGGGSYSAVKTEFSQEKIEFTENRYRWVAKDVPAFKEEPYLTTSEDYIGKINFELTYTKFPNSPIKNYSSTWKDVCQSHWDDGNFGKEMTGNGFLKKIAEDQIIGKSTPEEKLLAIYAFVKNNVTWDGSKRKFTNTGLRKVLDEKKGSSAEINLLLASMIEKCGFQVFPVLISTRDHGFVRQETTVTSQFNYVIALVRFDNKQILLDATDPLLPMSILPERCLNGQGLIISPNNPEWVNLTSNFKSKSVANAIVTLSPSGELKGNLKLERTGYNAYDARKEYLLKGEEVYMKNFLSSKDWQISKSAFEGVKEIDQMFKEVHEVEIGNHVTVAGDIIYVNPFLMMQVESNPFTLEKREYPVDFGFPQDKLYMVQMTLPAGFVVEELPKSKVLALAGNASKYVYNISIAGDKLVFTSNLSINKSLFTMIEYPDLREFYNQVAATQAQQVVLKKNVN